MPAYVSSSLIAASHSSRVQPSRFFNVVLLLNVGFLPGDNYTLLPRERQIAIYYSSNVVPQGPIVNVIKESAPEGALKFLQSSQQKVRFYKPRDITLRRET